MSTPAPAATPLAWQIDKHTEHNDRLMNLELSADFPYEVERGDVGDALAVIALRESMRRDLEAARGVRVRQAVELGATWNEVAAALDVTADDARALLRAWVDGQRHLHQIDVASGRKRPLGIDPEEYAAVLALTELGDDEARHG
ncbi:Rossmann-fold NAD(P)-binding domain-containing protein [Streptomyces prasinus]